MESEKKQTRKSKVDPGMSRIKDGEASVIRTSLGDFKAKGSKGEKIIEEIAKRPLKDISKNDLVKLTYLLCSTFLKKNVERRYKRNKELAVKLVNDNCDLIEPYIPYLTIHLEQS